MSADLWSREDRAWAAGLFEGEGTFCQSTVVTGKYTQTKFVSALSMTDQDVVERFASVMLIGRTYPLPPSNPKYLMQWRWAVQSFEMFQMTVVLLWPWLGLRRKAKAKAMLLHAREYFATKQPRFGWGKLHQRAISAGKLKANALKKAAA